MTALYDRVVEVLLPNPLNQVGVKRLTHERVRMIATTFHPLRMEWHELMGDSMRRVEKRLLKDCSAT